MPRRSSLARRELIRLTSSDVKKAKPAPKAPAMPSLPALVRLSSDKLPACLTHAALLNGAMTSTTLQWGVVTARTAVDWEVTFSDGIIKRVSPVMVEAAIAHVATVVLSLMPAKQPRLDMPTADETAIAQCLMAVQHDVLATITARCSELTRSRTLILSDRTCIAHSTPKKHPECPARLVATLRHLAAWLLKVRGYLIGFA